MAYQGNLLSKTLVIGIIFLFIVMSIFPSVAIDTVNIEHSNGKSSGDDIDWWPMFHHDPQHSGYSTSITPDNLRVLWTYKTSEHILRTSAVVADRRVYFGSFDGRLFCLNIENGSRIWKFFTQGSILIPSPAVAYGNVYIASYGKYIYCLNAYNGSVKWKSSLQSSVSSSITVANEKIFIGGGWNKVFCFNAFNGSVIWKYHTGNTVISTPAVVDGKVYVGSYDSKIHCINEENGSRIWTYGISDIILSSPSVVNEKVYIGSYNRKIYCLNANNGSKIWSYTTGGKISSSPAIADGKVYVGSNDKNVYCLDADTGDKFCNYTTEAEVVSSPAVIDGKVFVGSCDNKLYCFYGDIENLPPYPPSIIGPKNVEVRVETEYQFSLYDPNADELYLKIDWGTGISTLWLGPYETGSFVKFNHTWWVSKDKIIRAKLKDIHGAESDWATLEVTVPRDRATTYSLFQLLFDRFPLLEVIILRAMNLLR